MLKSDEIKVQYNVIVRNRYDQLKEEDLAEIDPYSKWNYLEKAIKEGNYILPKKERKALKPWMTEEILDMMDERRRLKGKNEDEYRSLNKCIHKECIKAKEIWMDEKCCEIVDLAKNDQQLMYEKVKEITCKKKINRSNAIKRDDETVLM